MKLILAKFNISIHYSGRAWYAYLPFADTGISYNAMQFEKL